MTTRRPIAAAFVALFLVQSAFGQAPPAGTAIEEGRAHFTRGVELFRAADYRGALAEFRRAYEVAPSNRILYNIGQSCYSLHDYAGALSAYERYLAEGGDQIPSARRTEVLGYLSQLKALVGQLVITTNPPGAEISIDDVPSGTTPLPGPVRVGIGRTRVTATMPGHLPVSRSVEVAAGDDLHVALDLVDAAAPMAAGLPPPVAAGPLGPGLPPQRPEAGGSTLLWIGVTATGALVIATGIFGGLSLASNSDFQNRLNQFPGSGPDIEQARSRVHTFSLVTDVLMGTTAVAGGATLYIALTRHSAPARVVVGMGSVSLVGPF